jgi:hypothetical protein
MSDKPISYGPGEAKDRETREYVLHYVAGRPGCDYADVVTDRPAGISRKRVEAAVKHLLYRQPKQLRSEHPEGTHAFGRGQARLWVRDPEAGR